MKAFEIQEFGIDKLALVDRETPRPGPGEVLVRLKAASLNYRDYLVVGGAYNPNLKRPLVPLSDGAGVVEEAGPGVTHFKKGDRVMSCFFPAWLDGPPTPETVKPALGGNVDGVLREHAVFREDGLVHTPKNLSDEEAATLPCAGLTAWHALFENILAQPGETVLLQGTGGVSIFGLQFAHAAGLRTIVTSSSDQKLERARKLGADEVINYKKTPEWDEEVRKLTAGQGVDHVIEVGGSDTIPRSLNAIRMQGTISVIGILSGVEPTISPSRILQKSVRVQGIYVGSQAMFKRMNHAVEFHKIKPVIDQVFPWTEAKEALRHMESQRHFGKICLKF
ncbi:MAG: NAD(P)-dependent alcohol dehydrogenase [Acidobacteriaceae bacterium]|nr:NAD(P)-dependent alcohol dehydrogenase [Acidobacteriaceae bacterium]